jgi:hypothetical protein
MGMIGGIGMREILFKAKDVKSGEWVQGYYAVLRSPEGSRYTIIPECPEILRIHMKGNAAYEIDPATLCQYTGMKDSKGERIFKNDILSAYFPETVEDGPVYLRVVWEGCGFRTWQYINGVADRELSDDLDCNLCIQAAVVGNAFDGILKREGETG